MDPRETFPKDSRDNDVRERGKWRVYFRSKGCDNNKVEGEFTFVEKVVTAMRERYFFAGEA